MHYRMRWRTSMHSCASARELGFFEACSGVLKPLIFFEATLGFLKPLGFLEAYRSLLKPLCFFKV